VLALVVANKPIIQYTRPAMRIASVYWKASWLLSAFYCRNLSALQGVIGKILGGRRGNSKLHGKSVG